MFVWILLIIMVIFEVLSAWVMRYFDNAFFSIFAIKLSIIYFLLLPLLSLIRLVLFAIIVQQMEVSVAYAIRYGLAISFISIMSYILFKEDMSYFKIASLILTIAGIVGLSLTGIERKGLQPAERTIFEIGTSSK
jgi:multidrug transporter EmrE-like cation transporter